MRKTIGIVVIILVICAGAGVVSARWEDIEGIKDRSVRTTQSPSTQSSSFGSECEPCKATLVVYRAGTMNAIQGVKVVWEVWSGNEVNYTVTNYTDNSGRAVQNIPFGWHAVVTISKVEPPYQCFKEKTVTVVCVLCGSGIVLQIPIEKCDCPTAPLLAFDAGEGGYPSISGTFKGTITPLQELNVSTIYTYPCPGTGGHTEYAEISNNSWSVETLPWSGYDDDWQNLTFNNPFTLCANETYNYTIVTGSYPQIIHEQSWNATGGVITCTEFVDINGKRHEGWIPAIKLLF